MSNFFDRLEIELAGLMHEGRHLPPAQQHERRRALLIRRVLILSFLVVVLAASLAIQFPASANGHTELAQTAFVIGR
jgi:hypothetical protein